MSAGRSPNRVSGITGEETPNENVGVRVVSVFGDDGGGPRSPWFRRTGFWGTAV